MNEGPLRRKGFYSGNRPLLTPLRQSKCSEPVPQMVISGHADEPRACTLARLGLLQTTPRK
jgi:hypothetical protein